MKAKIDDVVRYGGDRTGVVVDTRRGLSRKYGVVETDRQGRKPRGPRLWLKASEIEPLGGVSVEPARRYRVNQRKVSRGCYCHCCAHYRDRRAPREGATGTVLVDHEGIIRPLVERGDTIELTLVTGDSRSLLAVAQVISARKEGIVLDLYEG